MLFFKGVFPGGQGATIGVDFMIKTLLINGMKIIFVFFLIFFLIKCFFVSLNVFCYQM
jgi:hypothetical protein